MTTRTSRFQVQFDVTGDGEVRASLDSVAMKARESGRAASDAGNEWYDFGHKIGTAMKWAGGVAVAGIGLIIKNTMEAQQELAQLEAVLRSTGQGATYSRDQLVDMAEAIAAASTFSAGEIVKAETRLLSYSGVASEKFPQALQVAIDQAQRLGMSVESSAETIGRALESPQKAAAALAQQGFGAAFTDAVRKAIKELDEAGRTAEAQQIILDIMSESYGGAAQAARDTFGGALRSLIHTLNDLTTGEDGSLDGATAAVNDLIRTLNDPATKQAFASIAEGIAWVTQAAVTGISTLTNWTQRVMEARGLATGDLSAGSASDAALNERLATVAKRRNTYRDWDTRVLGFRNESNERIQREQIAAAEAEMREIQREMTRRINAEKFTDVSATVSSTYDPKPVPRPPGGGDGKQPRAAQLTDAEKAAKQLNAEYGRMLERLQQEIALNGQSGELARVNYQIKQDGLAALNPALAEELRLAAEQIDAQEKANALREEGARLTDDMRTPLEALNAQLARYRALLDAGAIDQTVYDRAKKDAEDAYTAGEEAAARAAQTFRTTQDVIADFSADAQNRLGADLYDAFSGNADRIEDRWKQMLLQLAAEWAAAKITEMFSNSGQSGGGGSSGGGFWASVASAIGSYFGGGRATGGGMQSGKLYELGEHGKPELVEQNGRRFLVSGAGGNVVPAQYAGAGGGASMGGNFVFDMTFNIDSGTTDEDEQGTGADEARQLGQLVKSVVKETMANEMRQGGLLWKMRHG